MHEWSLCRELKTSVQKYDDKYAVRRLKCCPPNFGLSLAVMFLLKLGHFDFEHVIGQSQVVEVRVTASSQFLFLFELSNCIVSFSSVHDDDIFAPKPPHIFAFCRPAIGRAEG